MKTLIAALVIAAMTLPSVARGEVPEMTPVEAGSDLGQQAVALVQTRFDEEVLDRAKYVTAVAKFD